MNKTRTEINNHIINIRPFQSHLGYLINAIENYWYQEDINFIGNTNLKNIEDYVFCKIILFKSSVPGNHGLTTLFDRGAIVNYPNIEDHLIRHIIIAHEIGHILLHSIKRKTDGIRVFYKIDTLLETEAFYFAERILLKRAKQVPLERIFGDNWQEYVKDYSVTGEKFENIKNDEKYKVIDDEIFDIERLLKDKIGTLQKGYNPDILGD